MGIREVFAIDCRIPADDAALLTAKTAVGQVRSGEINALTAARLCVYVGYLLVAGPQSRPVHYPVASEYHRHKNLKTQTVEYPVPSGVNVLRATGLAEVAIGYALFGGMNAERSAMGWGYTFDQFKTMRMRGLPLVKLHDPDTGDTRLFSTHPSEPGMVRLHAIPELINACRYRQQPMGYIDVIEPNAAEQWSEVGYDGSFVTESACPTVATIPVTGADCPIDIIPTAYSNGGWPSANG